MLNILIIREIEIKATTHHLKWFKTKQRNKNLAISSPGMNTEQLNPHTLLLGMQFQR